MSERGVRRLRLVAGGAAAVALVAGIALLASAGSTGRRSDPRSASVAACARSAPPRLFTRLPAGTTVVPLDSLVRDAVVGRLGLPQEVADRLDARELDRGGRRLAGVLVAPVGDERAAVTDAFAARGGGGLPREVALGRTRGTLITLDVSGRHVAAVLEFAGCRAVVVGARDVRTALRLGSALASAG